MTRELPTALANPARTVAMEIIASLRIASLALVVTAGLAFDIVATSVPGVFAAPPSAEPPMPAVPVPGDSRRIDRYGDPLPEGAIMRLGTVALRMEGFAALGFRQSGEIVGVADDLKLRVWPADLATKPAIISLGEYGRWTPSGQMN